MIKNLGKNEELFTSLISCIKELKQEVKELKEEKEKKKLYNNKSLQEYLGVKEQLLKSYRDKGEISYYKIGDKFWYSEDAVNDFLQRNYYPRYLG